MKQILRLAAVLVFTMLCSSLIAQNRVITGTVKDANGKSLPFLAVIVKGTTIGTYTDTAGKFTLTVDETAKTLSLSYPGMKTMEAPITDNMNITMTSDALGLDEVVVTAVGISAEKKAIGNATQVVNGDALNTSGTSNVMNELDGKVAGLQVISSSGDPGAGTYLNLRGPTSLTGNNQPLIVVDGIPIDNSINNYDPTFAGFAAGGAGGQLNGGTQPTNRGLDINPSDIESITVLKGPAATALYGISAANGALIITTKKGHKNGEGLGIEFNSSLTWSKVSNLPSYQQTYAQGEWTDANQEDPTTATYYGPTTGERTSWGPAISTLAYNGIPDAYYKQGEIVPAGPGLTPAQAFTPYDFFQTGVANDNNISFSGGNDKTTFRMSLGNLYQTGVIPLTSYNKTTIGLNGSSALSKKLKVSAGINYVRSVNDKAQQGNNTSGIMFLVRTPPSFDNSNGNGKGGAAAGLQSTYMLPSDSERDYRGGTPGYDNPYWSVNENTFVSTLNRVYGYSQLDYNLNDWITLTYRLGGDIYAQDDKNYYNPLSNTLNASGGGVFISDYINSLINSDFIVNINHKLSDKLNLNVVLGQNYYTSTDYTRLAEATGLTLPNFADLANGTSFNGTTEGEVQYRRSAWYGQAVLGYASQVYLTLSGRDETTSTLSPNNDNFFYPSVDLAWVFTETFKMNTNKVLPYGKLRLSYANVGKDAPSQALTTPFRVAGVADGYSTGVTFPFNGLPGYAQSGATTVMGNPNLLPESTSATEIGVDLGFLQNRISLSATYYSEKTTNEILSVPVPLSSGFAAEELNAGIITNKGVELTLNTTPVKTKSGFEWDLGFNWSKNNNLVVQLAPGVNSLLLDALGTLYDVPGQPTSEIYGTDYVRVPGTTYNPANPNANLVLDDQPGPNYGLPMASPNSPTALAKTQPDWIGGLTTSVRYKNFELGAVMSIRSGGYMWDGTLGAMQYYGTAGVTTNRGQAYTPPSGAVWGHLGGPNGTTVVVDPAAPGPETAIYSQYYYQNLTSIYAGLTTPNIYPSGYVRISQINLTYSLPIAIARKAHFTKVALTLFANNPFLWTKYPGVDPETSFAGPANAQGEDWFNNPGTKSYGVRLALGL
ncbi:MAG TPA: SusC/RagA family TonB-linked outer membrane protein [Bacteroidia bacterium]|jgi:TonB-linked SusC/RagA family outer membrane protein|nr:SusC/RagA family TonB-linked outer membrane protein [Bacteroidia bacterium]